jgi:hypothetical protein
LLLCRADPETGDLKYIGSTAKQALIDASLGELTLLDYSNLPPAMRLVCDAIRLNTIPAATQVYGGRKHFFLKTRLEGIKGEDKFNLIENLRLVIKEDGSILISKTYSSTSVITKIVPKQRFSNTDAIWLRGSDRFWVEDQLIHQSLSAIYTSKAQADLTKCRSKEVSAAYKIDAMNSVTGVIRPLYFYTFDSLNLELASQPDLEEIPEDAFAWKVNGDPRFFSRIFHQHFAGWIHKIKHRINIHANKVIAFKVDKEGVACEKKWDIIDGCFMQTGDRYLTKPKGEAQIEGEGYTMFAPIDVFQAFEFMSGLPACTKIVMQGNTSCIRFIFSTTVGDYTVFVPASRPNGSKDKKFVKRYPDHE